MANWLNASMHVCMIESEEGKAFANSSNLVTPAKQIVEDIIDNVVVQGELINLGLSFNEFGEQDSLKDVFSKSSINESLSILGYNKSQRHKDVLKKLIKDDLGSPLLLIPMGKEINNFHKMVVPFEPEFVTKRKLADLKWVSDQLGVAIDFVHFKREKDQEELISLSEIYEIINYWIEDLDFTSKINFKFPKGDALNSGLENYLHGQENYLLCVIDKHIKNSISISSNPTDECLMDIKEPVVIL